MSEHRETLQAATNTHGTAAGEQFHQITTAKLWQHVEMLTWVIYQSVVGVQSAQRAEASPDSGDYMAYGGTRCRCGCIVYPPPHAVGQVAIAQRTRNEGARQMDADLESRGWKPWKKTMRGGMEPRLDGRAQAGSSHTSSFAAISDGDKMDDSIGDFDFGGGMLNKAGEGDECAGQGMRKAASKRSQRHGKFHAPDDLLLDHAIAEAQNASESLIAHGQAECGDVHPPGLVTGIIAAARARSDDGTPRRKGACNAPMPTFQHTQWCVDGCCTSRRPCHRRCCHGFGLGDACSFR